MFIFWILFISLFMVINAACPENWHRMIIPNSHAKCIRYFDNPVNFSEAQYVCNEIYEGDLISINSAIEQKLLVQYLHSEIGFKLQPVTWIGGTLSSQTSNENSNLLEHKLKWVDGTQAKYHNLANPLSSSEYSGRERKCLKILSLIAKGNVGNPGMWSPDSCDLRDSGFVCQKVINLKENFIDRSRISNEQKSNLENAKVNLLIKQLTDQFNVIKELCESQIKIIEKLNNNFLITVQNLASVINKDDY